jgi:hypothetical protein
MNEKTRKKILELHKKGLTAYEIAKRLSVSYGGVRYVTDPAFREYMSQAHKKYFAELKGTPEAQTPPGHSNITQEDIEWLSQHRQRIEKSSRILKGAGVFFYCFVLAFAITAFFILIADSFAFIFVAAALLIALFFTSAITPNKYINEMLIGSVSGVIVGMAITLIYIAPIVSVMQYPITLQVFYPNHPNMTITQNCTGFTTSESGYLNGQPINPQNTTECNLPQSMAQYEYNPFNCNISGKNITCTAALDENVTWKGTILNISKR